jgi:hypothetical protein
MAKLTARVAMIIGGLCLLAFLAVIGLSRGRSNCLGCGLVSVWRGHAGIAAATSRRSSGRGSRPSIDQIDDEGIRAAIAKAGVK